LFGSSRTSPLAVSFAVGALVAALSVGAAGLSAGPDSAGAAGRIPAGHPLGPGCDRARPAVAHHAGGERLHHQPTNAPIPCLTLVGRAVESATIGVTRSGAVFFAPRDDNAAAPPQDTLRGPEFVVRSRDLGRTWRATTSGGPTTGGLVPPWMHVDPVTSRVWFLTTLPGLQGARLSWSDDEGRHWHTNLAVGCRGLGPTTCIGEGSEKVLEGPPPRGGSRPRGYPHVVYYCGNGGLDVVPTTLACYRSLDGGRTFTSIARPDPPGPLGACGISHVARPGAAGPDGDLYFTLDECGNLGIAISRNEGASWQRRMIARTSVRDVYTTSVATDSAGNIYVAWLAGTSSAGPGVAARGLPFLIVSRDHGRTWSRPMMVGAPGVRQAMHVAVSAAGAGHVAISYVGSTSSAQDAVFDGNITESFNVLARRPVFWSAAVNRPKQPLYSGAHREVFGDRLFFIGDAFGPDGTPWAAFHCLCRGGRMGVAARLVLP
jgi:hypothetical protein